MMKTMRAWMATMLVRLPDHEQPMGMAVTFDSEDLPTMWWVQRALQAVQPDATLLQLQKLERVPPVVLFHGNKED